MNSLACTPSPAREAEGFAFGCERGSTNIQRLETFARELFTAAGMDADKAATIAELLVLTDALGRTREHAVELPGETR